MFKQPDLFWKNFRLGTELQVSGSFIYNGLYALDLMEHFYFEEETFEFLYNIAQGLERLEKVTLILLEHEQGMVQEDYEKSLITHNHIELLDRIKQNKTINLGKAHIKFLQLLADFYRSMRYERYNMASVNAPNQDRQSFVKYLEDQLSIEIKNEMLFVTPNDERIKKFIGNIVSKITLQLYELIKDEAARLHIFVYEIRNESKAYKIFIAKQFTFEPERYMQREILLHLLAGKLDKGLAAFIKDIKPLPFESYNTQYYIKFLLEFHKHVDLQGEIDTIADDDPLPIERINMVKLIGTDADFEEADDDEEEWENDEEWKDEE
jgi:hypothetical protein